MTHPTPTQLRRELRDCRAVARMLKRNAATCDDSRGGMRRHNVERALAIRAALRAGGAA